MVRLLAPDKRPLPVDRQRAVERMKLQGWQLGERYREIPVGVTFKLYEDLVAPDYRVHELRVKGRRAYAIVEQLNGYGAGKFTVGMTVREMDGQLVAILPGV